MATLRKEGDTLSFESLTQSEVCQELLALEPGQLPLWRALAGDGTTRIYTQPNVPPLVTNLLSQHIFLGMPFDTWGGTDQVGTRLEIYQYCLAEDGASYKLGFLRGSAEPIKILDMASLSNSIPRKMCWESRLKPTLWKLFQTDSKFGLCPTLAFPEPANMPADTRNDGVKHVDDNGKVYCNQPRLLAPASFHVLPGPLALATHAAPAPHYTLHPCPRNKKS
ncbi:hypothetical protein Pelo_17185 [Pelomyxa schiedti]|nr:hypothetical protein Pelo_17185 [Pelomyxa schiedti]